jgi:hypothetical protein
MLRFLFSTVIVAMLLCCFMTDLVAQAQGGVIGKKTLTAATLDDLPVNTETYTAYGHTFSWTFDWDNVWTLGTVACVYPQVVSSGMGYVEICNNHFGNGHHQWVGGPVSTGYLEDYMRITKECGAPCNVMTNMVFTVTYVADKPSAPGGP